MESLNNIPLKRLGFLAPNDIKDVSSSYLVDKNLKSSDLSVPKEETYDQQQKNQAIYEERAKSNDNLLQKGDYVYLKLKEETFGKSFDIQVKQRFNLPKLLKI